MGKPIKRILLFCVLSLFALAVLGQSKELSVIEKKLDYAQSLYQNGSYDLVFSELESLDKRMAHVSDTLSSLRIQSKLLKLQTQYAILEFDKAKTSLSNLLIEVEQLPSGLAKDKSYLLLAGFYNETGSFLLASKALETCSVLANSIDKDLAIRYELTKLHTQIGQKKLKAAEVSLAKTETLLFGSDSVGKKRIEQKAELQVLKAEYLLSNGNLVKAKEHIETQKRWFENHKELVTFSQLLELEAEMYLELQQYSGALDAYRKAYTVLAISDYQTHKIYLLSKITTLCVQQDDLISYRQYMRRLQMYADKNIYRVNYFHLALSYSEAYADFVQGDYSQALNRIEKTARKCVEMPENHSFRKQLLSLKKEIYEESSQLKPLEIVLDSLVYLAKTYSGDTSPEYYEAKLDKLNFNLTVGKNFPEIEKELLANYKNLVLASIDSVSLLSQKYISTFSQLYFQTDRFALAAKASEDVLVISTELQGRKSWQYALELGKNIEKQIWAGNYTEAQRKQSAFLALEFELKKQKNSEQYLWYNYQVGKLAKLLGNFDQWKKYSLKAHSLLLAQNKNKILRHSTIKEQAASVYLETSNLVQAEKILLQALTNRLTALGNSSSTLLPVYQQLLSLHVLKGNYAQADKILKDYSNLASDVYGQTSISYSVALFGAGKYFSAIGDYKRAKENFEACLQIQKSKLGEQNLTESETYLELAQVNTRLFPEKANENEALYKKAGSIIERAIGQENVLYAGYQQQASDFYISTEKYDQATTLLSKANSFWERALGTNNIHSADIAMMFGRIAYSKSIYSEAEIQYSKAKSIYESIYSKLHPSASSATAKLGKVYYMLNNKEKCILMMEQCMPNYLNYVHAYFPSLSFKEKTKFWLGMKDEFEFYNFLVLSGLSGSQKKTIAEVYNNVITTKALLLSSDIKLRKQIATSGDTVLMDLFEEWLSQKEQVTALLSLSKEQQAEQGLDARQTELRLEQLEKEMGIRSTLFQSASKKAPPTWRNVQDQLNDKEYAIELVRYRYFNKTFSDSVIYAAMIVGKESKDGPEVVLFPQGSKMEKGYYKYYRNSVVKQVDDELSYKNFWQPIQSKIHDKALVYLSSDGVYNQINLEMLRDSAGKFVIDNTQIVQVTNTKDIIAEEITKQTSKAKTVKANDQIILCGNPAFYATHLAKESVPSLVGAENEVNAIQDILQKANKNYLKLMNAQVTEDTVMSFRNPKALHIATHGYFKETVKNNLDDFNSNPLLNSGLMLSGSGNILDNTENNYVNASSGILTAYEALNMNLDNTEMVVLSACETGKGQVEAGEGVYGLQRAFLVAGANCVIISLFKVNDLVTKELMEEFYTNWLRTNDKRSSFNAAKIKIKEKYNTPVYWGAFIMIEGKRQRKVLN